MNIEHTPAQAHYRAWRAWAVAPVGAAASFDFVVANHVLEHVSADARAFCAPGAT